MTAVPPVAARGRGRFMRMFGSAVGSQALLSGANLLVGLLLIRCTAQAQYGAYVLVANGFLLLASLQNAFFGPTLILRMAPLQPRECADLIGDVHAEQRQLLCWVFAPLVLLLLSLWAGGAVPRGPAVLLLAASLAAPAVMTREYFRTAALAQRRPQDVVRADLLYALCLVAGAALATRLTSPAAAAVLLLGLAAAGSGVALARMLRRREPGSGRRSRGILRQISGLGAWSVAGAAIHWTFSQGYGYLIAATLDVSAVAAVAATRLLLMPINLLSTGVGSLMLPLSAEWMQRHPAAVVLRRLLLVALGLAAGACCYLALMWLLRGWIFAHLLKKQFAQRDLLLLLWSAIYLLTTLRDQTVPLIVARGQLRRLTTMTAGSAALSLLISYWGMRHFGVPGALLGVLCGELANVAGILTWSVAEARRRPPAAGAAVGATTALAAEEAAPG